jgi:putative protease
MGEFVGTVKDLRPQGSELRVAGTSSFANGDGLCFIDDERQLQGFRVNRAEGNRLMVAGRLPSSLRRGMSLYRNNDQQMERLLAAKSSERKIPVTMTLEVTPEGYRLIVDDGRHEMMGSIVCEHQQAQKPQHDNIVRELSKLGNTPYECTEVRLPEGFDGFIPASRLSELRRNSLTSSPNDQTPNTPKLPNDQSPKRPNDQLNVANKLSRQFYASHNIDTVPAFELQEPQGENVLMQCRHCLRFALGHCVKHGGTPPTWHEPLFLTLANGRRFRLHFDCKNCVMKVYSVPSQR